MSEAIQSSSADTLGADSAEIESFGVDGAEAVAPAAAPVAPRTAELHRLFVLNMALQLFDGVATYQGMALGFREANPLLISAFGVIGVGQTLLLYKAYACGLLVVLTRIAPPSVAIPVMRGLAAIYCTFSLAPWLGKFASLVAGII